MPVNAAAVVMTELPSLIYAHGRGSVLTFPDGRQERIEETPMQFLESLVLLSCSTLQGRVEAFRKLMHVSQKPCILISECTQKLYFPTRGSEHPDCQYVLYQDVISYHAVDSSSTQLILTSGYRVNLDVNVRTIKGQMDRCDRFLKQMNPIRNER
ncbi:MAG: competence protein ComK [Bulleidia sp.]